MADLPDVDQAIQDILDIKRLDPRLPDFPWSKLNNAFRLFWASEPTEEHFSRVMYRCPLSARMLYIMRK